MTGLMVSVLEVPQEIQLWRDAERSEKTVRAKTQKSDYERACRTTGRKQTFAKTTQREREIDTATEVEEEQRKGSQDVEDHLAGGKRHSLLRPLSTVLGS